MKRATYCLLGCLSLLPAIAPAVAFAADPEPLIEYQLGQGLVAAVGEDGTITVLVGDGVYSAPTLTCTWPHRRDPRVQDDPRVFVTLAREGDEFGHRGLTRDADDDGDGRTDEDRLDGEDNDGDGRIDEDHAAISHAMAVWNWRHGRRERHLETYRWSYPRLSGLVVAVFSARGATPPPLNLDIADATWIKTDEFCFREELAAAGPSFVARVPDPRHPERWLWLGVAMLDAEPRGRAADRVRAADSALSVPLLGRSQAVALAAGPTRLRVVNDLAAAVAIRAGVVDPVTERRMRWVPPALPPVPPAGDLPVAVLHPEAAGGFELELRHETTPRLFFDPDLFRVDGEELGVAEALHWRGDDGADLALEWPRERGLVDACHPFDHLDPAAAGTLVLRFEGTAPITAERLDGVLEDGRSVSLPVSVVTPELETAAAPAAGLEVAEDRLELSPRLLTNFPNPFRSSTQVSFRVPATAGEAFAWEGDGDPPFDPRQRLPLSGGGAAVSVTVYDLEGRVIARLHDGNLGVGDYRASWNGTDQLGRTMASGAYFCKLQIEKWSVTKRLVFIR